MRTLWYAHFGATTTGECHIASARNPGETPDTLPSIVEHALDMDKAEDIKIIPLADKSSMADYMVIASGRSTRQVISMAEKLRERLAGLVPGPIRIEGMQQGDWVVLDAGDIVVHLFRPEVRDFYNLERLWGAAARIDNTVYLSA